VLSHAVASLPTPAAIIVSGGNIDANVFERFVAR
jgi:hypothetical protein